jgi:hypothetical protein
LIYDLTDFIGKISPKLWFKPMMSPFRISQKRTEVRGKAKSGLMTQPVSTSKEE